MSDVARIMELLKMIDDKNDEIDRLRAALREIVKVERDLFEGDTLAYEYAKEALGDEREKP